MHAGAIQMPRPIASKRAEALTPAAPRDVAMRGLTRQDLDRVIGGATRQSLLGRLVELVGQDPSWDAELLDHHGGYVRSLLMAQRSGDQYENFRKGTIAKLINTPGGSERQRAARNALLAFRSNNVRGRIAAYHQAARMLLG